MNKSKLLQTIAKEREEIAFGICDHPVESYEAYMSLVGHYQGLKTAERIVREITKEEDEDEQDNG